MDVQPYKMENGAILEKKKKKKEKGILDDKLQERRKRLKP